MADRSQTLRSFVGFSPIAEEASSYTSSITDADADSFDLDIMNGSPTQQRLYIINRSGSGEALYVLLNKDRTEIESYGVRMDTWRVTKGVANFGVATVDNMLYIIGGYDIANCKHLHRVLRYDPHESTWSERAPLLKARAKFGVSVLEGKIFVSGGTRSDGRVSGSCEVYDPVTDVWSDGGLLVAPRANHSCVVFMDEMYLAGGVFGTQSHDNFWVYEKNAWEELDVDYPHCLPRCIDRAAMATVGNKIFFIGGVSCRSNGPNEAAKFMTERGMFSFASKVSALQRQRSQIGGLQSDMITPWRVKYPSMAHARHSPGVHVLGSRIYVFGGSHLDTGQDVRVVEFFDTETNTWEEDFRLRKGNLSNVVCAVIEVPRRHDDQKVNVHLKWVLW